MQTFSVYLRPEDPASGLPEYATCTEARAAWLAKSQAMAMLDDSDPDNAHQYAEPRVCEDRPGLPRPAMNVLSTDFMKTYRWDEENQVFAERPQAASGPVNFGALSPEQKMAVLVRHGTTDINSEQLTDAQLLLTREQDSPEGHMVESLVRAKGISAMYPDAVLELIGELGNHFDGADNWPQMKAFNEKWLRDRHAARKEDNAIAALHHSEPEKADADTGRPERSYRHNYSTLDQEIASALWPGDVTPGSVDSEILRWAKREVIEKDREDWKRLSMALRIREDALKYDLLTVYGLVRNCPPDLHKDPAGLKKYVTDFLSVNGVFENDEAQQNTQSEENLLASGMQAVDPETADTEQSGHPTQTAETQSPVTERTGPFYLRNEAGQVKRANKVTGFAELLTQGFTEISKEDWLALKNALADTSFRETENSSTGELRENDDPSTSTDDDAAAHDEKIAENTSDIAPSDEGEKTEVGTAETTPADPEPAAPAFPAVFDYGRYEGIPNDVYHAASGISSSMVKDARISLMYYHGRYITHTIRRETSDALTFGTLVHTVALEPEKLSEEFARPFVLPEGAVSTTAEMKAIIEKYNAALTPVMNADEVRALLEKYNSTLPKPFTTGSSTEETGFLYNSLPEEFKRIAPEAKHTGTAMKACIKEYNASLPAPLKTSGSREALLCGLEQIAQDVVADERSKPQPFSTSGSKDELAAIVRQIAPDTLFADELREQWEKENEGKSLITAEQHALALAIQKALFTHPEASKWLTHPLRKAEVSYFGLDEETGLEVRVRPDLEIDDGSQRIAFDIKTVSMPRVRQDNLPWRLHREIIERDYHLSAALYCDVAMFDRFFWIFVNKEPGYHWVTVVEASEDELALGRAEYRLQLAAIRRAMDTGVWPSPIADNFFDILTDNEYARLKALTENGAAS